MLAVPSVVLGLAAAIVVACWLPAAAGAQGVSSTPSKISIKADVPGLLYPGARAKSIPLTLSNPTSDTVYFTRVSVGVLSTDTSGCSADWFRTGPAKLPKRGIAVPARGSVTLPAKGAGAPSIQMIDSGSNQDVCKNAELTLRYAWRVQDAAAGQAAQAQENSTGVLPFTGLLLWLLAGAGVLLGLAGATLRRASRAPRSAAATRAAEARR